MIIEIVPIQRFRRVQYYTIHLEGKAITEFGDFLKRMNLDEQDRKELTVINKHIELIGKQYGAYPRRFRHERAAEALPPCDFNFLESDTSEGYGLRLYCLRLSPFIVILLNGDRKTTFNAQECPNCKKYYNLAQRIARRINQATADGYIRLNEEDMELEVYGDIELSD